MPAPAAAEKKRGNSEGKPAGFGGLMTDVQGEGGQGAQKKAQKRPNEGDCLQNGVF